MRSARTFGKRAGIFAAATMFALVPPFVYYAKTANLDVPYLFWFALSLVFYLRFLERPASCATCSAFAACGTLAICTKDQAYGLYLLTPLPIVHPPVAGEPRRRARAHPLARALFDPGARVGGGRVNRLVRGLPQPAVQLLAASSSTCGTSPAAAARPIATSSRRSPAGSRLLRLTGDLVRVCLGWPLLLVSLAGVVLALLARRRTRRVTFWLAIPVVSYYLGFINVVLYNYDRFMLPVCLVLAMFGGLAIDRWLCAGGRGRRGARRRPRCSRARCCMPRRSMS